MKALTGSPFLEDWVNVRITVYVDHNVRFGKETVEGLRISPHAPEARRKTLTPAATRQWESAKAAFKRDGNLNAVLEHVDMSEEHQAQIKAECEAA